MTLPDVRRLAFQLAERNGIDHPFNREHGLAGEDWAYGFIRRHPQTFHKIAGNYINRESSWIQPCHGWTILQSIGTAARSAPFPANKNLQCG